eukprot:Skav219859  [mRNA]  locus=scaffold859:832002:835547:- [translate_table: standard]
MGCQEWSESEISRDMWPSFPGMLELGTLQRLYNLQRIHKEVRPTSQIYLATQPVVAGKAPAPELLMRAVYLSRVSADGFSQCITDSLDVALEEVEHVTVLSWAWGPATIVLRRKAMLDPRVAKYGPGVSERAALVAGARGATHLRDRQQPLGVREGPALSTWELVGTAGGFGVRHE